MYQSVGARKFKINQLVTATVSRKVCGDAEPRGGVRIAVKQRRLVEERAVRPRLRSAEEESQVDADSSSDAEVIDAVLGAGKVVDTDDERSAGSLDSSSSSGDDPFIDKCIIPKPLKAATGASATGGGAATGAAATGALKARRAGFEPLWSDPYFTVWGHPKVDFVRALVRDCWRKPLPEGVGTTNVSRQLTPRHYGEGCDDPVRSLLLARAWALWRARQGGWADSQRGRARHFREQEILLERDVRSLHSECLMLGDKKANSLLKGWAPDIVAKLVRHD